MTESTDRQPIAWGLWARRIMMVLLPLSLLGGWWLDHARQTEALEPLRKQLEDRQATLRNMQTQLARYMAFDGFDSVAEVIEIMQTSLPDFAYEKTVSGHPWGGGRGLSSCRGACHYAPGSSQA